MIAIRITAVACVLTAVSWAQQIKLDLDHLAAKASKTVDLSLGKNLLQFAARFLDSHDKDEAKAREIIIGLEGIYIKSFEFNKDGQWNQGDLDRVRTQLRGPEWSRIFGVKSEDHENVEVWVRNDANRVSGIVLLSSEPRQLTVANIVGNVSLDSLAEMGGQFGLPKVKPAPAPTPAPAPVPKKRDE